MKFSEQWLRTMVDPSLSSEELSHLLTMAGLEVEELDPVAPEFNSVVVAEILSAEKHPDADRLQVLSVKVGDGEPLQIVCGAPNARAGLKAPCALVGAKLPGFDIKRAKVRGVESFGMMCSAKELGITEESNGLLELPTMLPYLAAVGVMQGAGWGTSVQLLALIGYCLVMIVPALALVGARALAGPRIEAWMQKMGAKAAVYAQETLGWVVGIAGYLLIRASLSGQDLHSLFG